MDTSGVGVVVTSCVGVVFTSSVGVVGAEHCTTDGQGAFTH